MTLAAPKTQLQTLRDNLGVIDGKIRTLGRPIHAVQNVIRLVKAPLNLPPTIIKRLDDLRTVLMAIRLVTTALSWVPGPIGTGAKAADRAIAPLVAAPPPPKGILQNARASVADIDRMVKPARAAIGNLEKPVDKIVKTIDGLQGKVAALIAMTDRLLQHYGNNPPPGVEACAARLNGPLAAFLTELAKFEATIGKGLDQLKTALDALLAGLKPLSDVAASIESALKVFDTKAFRAIRSLLAKLVSALEPVRAAVEKGARWLLDQVLGMLHIDLKAIERFFNQVVDRLNPMKRIQAEIDKLKGKVQGMVDRLLQTAGITEVLDRLEALQATLEGEIDKFLQSACGKVMLPPALPGEARRR